MIKLNGGLGTSMGMDKAKSLLPVRDGRSFLDLIVDQVRHARLVHGVRLPMIFMNSFRTRGGHPGGTGWDGILRLTDCRWTSCRTRSRSSSSTT